MLTWRTRRRGTHVSSPFSLLCPFFFLLSPRPHRCRHGQSPPATCATCRRRPCLPSAEHRHPPRFPVRCRVAFLRLTIRIPKRRVSSGLRRRRRRAADSSAGHRCYHERNVAAVSHCHACTSPRGAANANAATHGQGTQAPPRPEILSG